MITVNDTLFGQGTRLAYFISGSKQVCCLGSQFSITSSFPPATSGGKYPKVIPRDVLWRGRATDRQRERERKRERVKEEFATQRNGISLSNS